MDAGVPLWLPIVTLVGGYIGSLLTEAFRDKRARDREAARARDEREQAREQREAEREREVVERREQFQRETLLALQPAFLRAGRAWGASHHHDEMAVRQGASWGATLLPEELDRDVFQAFSELVVMEARVHNADLREKLGRFRSLHARSVVTRDAVEAQSLFQEALDLYEQVAARIGELLRALY